MHIPLIAATLAVTLGVAAQPQDSAPLYIKVGDLQKCGDVEYMNDINQQTLDNEAQVFQRLGNHEGIITHFRTSQYGIELALAQENLESYLETYPERDDSVKISWIWCLINTFAHVHTQYLSLG